MAEPYLDRVKNKDIEATLEPLLRHFKANRNPGEGFGDFTARIGFAALKALSPTKAAPAKPAAAAAGEPEGEFLCVCVGGGGVLSGWL